VVVTVITPSIRPDGAIRAAESVQQARQQAPDVEVRHLVAYWVGPRDPLHLRVGAWRTQLIAESAPGWLVFLDDDNLMHVQLLARLDQLTQEHPQIWAFVFACSYPEMNGGVLLPKLPPRAGYIDGGQAVLWRDYAVQTPWPPTYEGDGKYLANLYALAPDRWLVIDEVLVSHNAQVWQ
jgi:hypothetical protein